MGAIKRNIPNFITCLNLSCGFIGIIFIIKGYLFEAVYIMFIAAVFDFLDGLSARMLKVTSPIGRDLDSLADIITFGVLPGIMMFKLINIYPSTLSIQTIMASRAYGHSIYQLLPYFSVLIPVCSAIRLAKFNNDPTQSYSFKGLPTPANGLLIASLFYWVMNTFRIQSMMIDKSSYIIPCFSTTDTWGKLIFDPFILCFFSILLSILLVSNLRLMAFKFKGFGWKANQWKYILLILCVPLMVLFQFASAPIILLLYIIISQIHFRTKHEIQS